MAKNFILILKYSEMSFSKKMRQNIASMARQGKSFDIRTMNQQEEGMNLDTKDEAIPSKRMLEDTNENLLIQDITLDDLAGIESIQQSIKELVVFPIKYPYIYELLGTEPSNGIILHGVPGSGKTTIARAVAGTLQVPFFHVSSPEVVSGVSGESESFIRNVFSKAMHAAPSIVFIDDIDTIAGKRDDAPTDMGRRIVTQIVSCLDDVHASWKSTKRVVQVICATSRLDTLDASLRRTGRFDREIALPIPTREAREAILRYLLKNVRTRDDIDICDIAMRTPGYVCSDLCGLIKEATIKAIRRIQSEAKNETEDYLIDSTNAALEMPDFDAAIQQIQPSALREGFTIAPNVRWSDVGSLHDVKRELFLSIILPIRYPSHYKHYGITQSMGVLLSGPPGCGKTLLAKAVANEAGANFISIKGPEILNKYVGESEKSIRTLFARARSSSPCVLFFDELDALAPSRGSSNSNSSTERVVNQLLTEMDGMDARDISGVYVIAATNRPDLIDPALKRPGRLDKCLSVQLPDASQRMEIMQTISRKLPLAAEVDLHAFANDERLEGLSGADLASWFREAGLVAVQEDLALEVSSYGEDTHNQIALDKIHLSPQNESARIAERRITVHHLGQALSKVRRSVIDTSVKEK